MCGAYMVHHEIMQKVMLVHTVHDFMMPVATNHATCNIRRRQKTAYKLPSATCTQCYHMDPPRLKRRLS